MSKKSLLLVLVVLNLSPSVQLWAANAPTFSLPTNRSADPQNYRVTVDMSIQSTEADKVQRMSYVLDLDCKPLKSRQPNTSTVRYTSRQFSIEKEGHSLVTLPALQNWSYDFAYPTAELAPDGNVFGLPNKKFQGLSTSDGKQLNSQADFLVYNAFTDYHVLCNVYAQQPLGGKGVQDLHHIGQQIRHATSGTEAPLGNVPGLADGSHFAHGEVTLSFKGLSYVNGHRCAIVGFDAGENEFKMVIEPAPNFQVVSRGKSHHEGDLYIDLESGWVAKADMTEVVIGWVTVAGKTTGPTVTRRELQIDQRDAG